MALLSLLILAPLATAQPIAAGVGQQRYIEAVPETNLPVCLLEPLFGRPRNGGEPAPATAANATAAPPLRQLLFEPSARWAAAALLAIKHVNSRNCSVLGQTCVDLLSVILPDNGTQFRFVPSIFDLHNFDPSVAAISTLGCAQRGGQFLLGQTTSEQSGIISPLADIFGQLLISSYATSPFLSDKNMYPSFARTSLSSDVVVRGLSVFVQRMGWRQVACLHNGDLYGNGIAESLSRWTETAGIALTRISLGVIATEQSIRSGIEELAKSGIKVVVLAVLSKQVPMLMETVHAQLGQEEYDKHTWIFSDMDVADILSDNKASLQDSPQRRSLLDGMISASPYVDARQSEALKVALFGFENELLDHLENDMVDVFLDGTSQPRTTQSTGKQHIASEVADPVTVDGTLDMYSLTAYDSVWALAAAVGATLRGLPPLLPEEILQSPGRYTKLAREVIRSIQEQRVPSFHGLSGWRAWAADGDPDDSGVTIIFNVFGQTRAAQAGSSTLEKGAEEERPQAAVYSVGNWTEADGISLYEESPVVWRDGTQYPTVPSDGWSSSEGSLMFNVLLAAAFVAATACLGASVAMLLRRNKQLHKRVNILMSLAQNGLALDSPLHKMLDFLQRFQETVSKSTTLPTAKEAAELQDLIVSSNGNLMQPNLEQTLGHFSPPMRCFLLDQVRVHSSTCQVDAPPPLHFIEGSRRALPEGELFASRLRSFSSEEGSTGDSCASETLDPSDLPGNSPTTLPTLIRAKIGHDFFLDMVTEGSAVRRCASPLVAVASECFQNSVAALKHSDRAMRKLLKFAKHMEAGYPKGLYHCKLHAADVTNRMAAIMAHTGLADVSPRPNISLGLVANVAAVVHDYRHPQRSNSFLIAKEHFMATQFNDQSVAENYSLREAMTRLKDKHHNFLSALTGSHTTASWEISKYFRELVIQMVLGTEMARHFDVLGQFQTQEANSPHLRIMKAPERWVAMNEHQRLLTLQMALKVADLGHCALPLDQHIEWVKRLEEELFVQGDEERRLGLAISPLMDRRLPGVSAPESQAGFYQVVVLPLFLVWAKSYPSCEPLLRQAQKNFNHWQTAVTNSEAEVSVEGAPLSDSAV